MSRTIATCLARCIEAYARRLADSHPLMNLAEQGHLSPVAVGDYLANARFLVHNTPRHLALAAYRSDQLGLTALASFYRRKHAEELGHEAWAASDMAHLEHRFGVECSSHASPHLRDLIHYLDRVIAARPEQYLAYTLFAEYFTVLVGPTWVSALREHCGIPAAALSVVANHAELDKKHVEEQLEAIDRLLGSDSDAVAYLDVLHRAMRYFEGFCDELYAAYRPGVEESVAAAE
jgi:pyrroloquinoline quinone (PQQ) biosynthesis protein C